MGGKGAKERRRLKRRHTALEGQSGEEDHIADPLDRVDFLRHAAKLIPSAQKEASRASESSSSSSDSSSDSESGSDVELNEQVKRQRGRRRRGRQCPDKQRQQEEKDEPSAKETTETPFEIVSLEADGKKRPIATARARRNKDDTRRCIGRKPVTDFAIGQRYPGKIVYIKPFGVFIDIGCHSDAFCHISRLLDGYVENASDVVKVDQEVIARVVEVDRKQKRITVSLQSDDRIEDERVSAEARKERETKREMLRHQRMSKKHGRDEQSRGSAESEPQQYYFKQESQTTPAGSKRARKLARRAQRRLQKDETGIAA
jgi:predicted RNA-binding protein with RPS1 domain